MFELQYLINIIIMMAQYVPIYQQLMSLLCKVRAWKLVSSLVSSDLSIYF